ncbi:MAG: protein translocase subunit SecD [Pseudomonadota bacterium]|nr:protein translocase subunit SecD [Pseudomonadota bacterium]
MLHYPAWKTALVLLICAAGVLFAAPNAFYSTVERANDGRAAIEAGRITPEAEADAASWPSYLPSSLVNLGLDLRGGAHLLVEVAVADVHAERLDALWPEARRALRDLRDQVGPFRRIGREGAQTLSIRLEEPGGEQIAAEALRDLAQPVSAGLLGAGGPDISVDVDGQTLTVSLTEGAIAAMDDRTMAQSLEIVRRRIDETGTREPTIQRQGADRILVQVPGIGSAEELLAIIGKTAKLTFHMVDSVTDAEGQAGPNQIKLPDADDPTRFYLLERQALITGDRLTDAQPGFDSRTSQPVVNFRFDAAGARRFGEVTAANVGRPFAIVLDDEVITAPNIREPITGGSGQISGSFTVETAANLSILLRAGALPAEITVLEQRTVGPDLGADSIAAGEIAVVVAFAAVLIVMLACYGMFGLYANIALIINVALLLAILSVIGATLTLPGIAGIVLTIGMAVDANVLIFERIREELRAGKPPARAIETGYERAFTAIVDANVTTFIAAVLLFAIGSGPVKGFSVTLGVGIVTSVFSAIMVTRLMVAVWFARARPKTLTV